MNQNRQIRDPNHKSDNYHFAIILQTLTNQTIKPTKQLLVNLSLGRQVFQSTKTTHQDWNKQNVLNLNGQRLNFVVFNYRYQKTQGFVIRLCQTNSQQGQSIAQSPIDCASFIDGFLQTQNGAYKQTFILSNNFILEAQVYVQKNRYSLEKLVKTIKSPNKQRQKSTIVLQTIISPSKISQIREKSISKQNRFKRASSPARRQSNERFSRSKTPKRLPASPYKQNSNLKIQTLNLKSQAQSNAQGQKIDSKRVYTSVEKQQLASIQNIETKAGGKKQIKKQQGKLTQIEPLQVANNNQSQQKQKLLEKSSLKEKEKSIKPEQLKGVQNISKQIVQVIPQNNQTENSQNKTQNLIEYNGNQAFQPVLAQDNQQIKIKYPRNIVQVQQIELHDRMPFEGEQNIGQTTQVIINLPQKAPSSEQIIIPFQQNKEWPATKTNQQVRKNYIFIQEDTNWIKANQEIIQNNAPVNEQKTIPVQIQYIENAEIIQIQNLKPNPVIVLVNQVTPVLHSSPQQQKVSEKLIVKETLVVQAVPQQATLQIQETQKIQSGQMQQIKYLLKQKPQVLFQPNFKTMLVIGVILAMIIIQSVIFQDSEDIQPLAEQTTHKFKEKKVVKKQKILKKKK